ncbi:MAG TPA: hypothetical protein VGC45_14270 [Gryllotalpicola sp.]
MPFEYSAWGRSPVWGETQTADRPHDHVLPTEIAVALFTADPPPPYRGGVQKQYPNRFSRALMHWDNKLLHPDQARRVAAWLYAWADAAAEDLPMGSAMHARTTAAWLEAAADGGWFLDWSQW